jgi:peptidoglycan hydrolase-like protein with peptidoglycan-binding domain
MKKILASIILSATVLPFMAQAEIVSLQSQSPVKVPIASPLACFDFKTTLKMGSKSYEVRGLQFALMKEGFSIPVSEYGMFGSSTLDAVNAFQQKYAGDILVSGATPTGAVGKMTRTKLNSLYGCNVLNSMNADTPNMSVLSTEPSEVSLSVKSVALDASGVTGTFCNKGNSDVPTFPVRLRLNGVIRDFNVLGALKVGTCDTQTLPYGTWGLTYDPTSVFNLVSQIDPTNIYAKNTLTYPSVGTSTLAIPAITGAHLAVRGVAIKSNGVQATLCNLGSSDLTSYPVRVVINGTTKDVDIAGAYTRGQCPTVTWTYDQFGLSALPPSGTLINAVVTIDPNNVIKEINEFDNSATVLGNI